MNKIERILYYGIMHVQTLMIVLIIFMFSGCVLAGLTSCKSVRKSQNEKLEQSTVKKSDSSSSKSYSYVDTTKTDSSTEVTTTTVTIDSIEYDYVPETMVWFDTSGPIQSTGRNGCVLNLIDFVNKAPSRPAKAKGINITTTTIKQAAIKAKGVTIKEDVKQADIKTEEKFAKRELSKEVVKKPSINMGIGLAFGIAIVIGLIWVIIWVYRKKKAAAKAAIEAAGKIL